MRSEACATLPSSARSPLLAIMETYSIHGMEATTAAMLTFRYDISASLKSSAPLQFARFVDRLIEAYERAMRVPVSSEKVSSFLYLHARSACTMLTIHQPNMLQHSEHPTKQHPPFIQQQQHPTHRHRRDAHVPVRHQRLVKKFRPLRVARFVVDH